MYLKTDGMETVKDFCYGEHADNQQMIDKMARCKVR